MAYTYTWNSAFEAAPADTDLAEYGASQIRNLKVAIRERCLQEMNWEGSGQPLLAAGIASVCFVGTLAQIQALTGPASNNPSQYGLAYATDKSTFYYYSGSTWVALNLSGTDATLEITGVITGAASGVFTVGETATQSGTGVTGTVVWAVPSGGPLVLTGISGAANASGVWTGASSGAVFTPSSLPINTTNNVSTLHHGFAPQLPTVLGTSEFLRGDGSWAALGDALQNQKLVITYASATSVTIKGTVQIYGLTTPVNLTCNLSNSGLNGLDTGSFVVNEWYYFYLIWDGFVLASLASLSATAPTMPTSAGMNAACTASGVPFAACTGSGTGTCIYPNKLLVGCAPTVNLNTLCTASGAPYSFCTGSGTGTGPTISFPTFSIDENGFFLYGDDKYIDGGTTSVTWKVESCVALIPPISARGLFQIASSNGGSGSTNVNMYLRKNGSSGSGHLVASLPNVTYSGANYGIDNAWVDTDASQSIQLSVNATSTWQLYVLGFKLNL